MKRLIICLVLLMLPCVALANGWSAPSELLALFEGDDDYADYICRTVEYSEAEDTAWLIMGNGYHNQLICAEKVDGRWRIAQVSTKAVHQRGEKSAVLLTSTPNGFVLSYTNEWYEFAHEDEFDRWVLQCAWVDDVSFGLTDSGMLVTDEDGTALWRLLNNELLLEDFNINLFPRSTDEVKQLNELWAVIAGDFWLDSVPQNTPADMTLPVYSAPSEDSWRAADGKASVSLRDTEGLRTFGMVDGWQLIEYRVSLSTSRIGYIQAEEDEFVHYPLLPTTVIPPYTDTWLTDDPNVSQYHQMTIPACTEMTALSVYPPFYAYVETALDGKAVRGFVPLRDLYVPADIVWDSGLEGAWVTAGTCLAFADMSGMFTAYDLPTCTTSITGSMLTRRSGGYWEVTTCSPERFFSGETLALTLVHEDGTAEYYGLQLDGDLLRLDDQESYEEYQRAEAGQDEIERAMMALVAGTYEMYAGGDMLPSESFTLYPDGTMEAHDTSAHTGAWRITRYNPAEAASWDFPEYAFHLTLDNGYSCTRGCRFLWIENDVWEPEPFLGISLTNWESGGSYARVDVEAGLMLNIAGRYKLSSGVALLTDYLFISPDGKLELGTDDRMDEAGFWIPEASGESGDMTGITFYFFDSSPIHPGEVLRLDCVFTPGTDASPAALTFSQDGNSSYVWYEAPGNG